jgi:hypothetical protein
LSFFFCPTQCLYFSSYLVPCVSSFIPPPLHSVISLHS